MENKGWLYSLFFTTIATISGTIWRPILLNLPIGKWAKYDSIIPICFFGWYLVNRSPYDFVYKLLDFLPFKIVLFSFDTLKRSRNITDAIIESKNLGLSFVGCVIVGTLSSTGSSLTKNLVDRLNGKGGSSEISKPGW